MHVTKYDVRTEFLYNTWCIVYTMQVPVIAAFEIRQNSERSDNKVIF